MWRTTVVVSTRSTWDIITATLDNEERATSVELSTIHGSEKTISGCGGWTSSRDWRNIGLRSLSLH